MAESGKSFVAGAVAFKAGQDVLKAQIVNFRVYRIGQRGQEALRRRWSAFSKWQERPHGRASGDCPGSEFDIGHDLAFPLQVNGDLLSNFPCCRMVPEDSLGWKIMAAVLVVSSCDLPFRAWPSMLMFLV
jgi:hypothetical protein